MVPKKVRAGLLQQSDGSFGEEPPLGDLHDHDDSDDQGDDMDDEAEVLTYGNRQRQ